MMTTEDYVSTRETLLQKQKPFIVLEKEELVAEGGRYYRVGDTLFSVTPEAQRYLDRQIGLNSKQQEGFKEAYGEKALAHLRNSFSMADCVRNPSRFALIANPEECVVEDVVPLVEEVVPMRSFFDIVELFADKHAYEVAKIYSYENGIHGITVELRPVHPQYDTFGANDEFITNGLYMKWTLSGIELGNYYLRLVCTNGSMQISKNSLSKIHQVSTDGVSKILAPQCLNEMMIRNLETFKTAAMIARDTPASLSEVYCGKRLLLRHGSPENLAETLMPYTELLEKCNELGGHIPATQAKSNIKMWDLFNRLTDFASHADLWDRNLSVKPNVEPSLLGLDRGGERGAETNLSSKPSAMPSLLEHGRGGESCAKANLPVKPGAGTKLSVGGKSLAKATDIRAASLMQQSMSLLLRKRDIQTYYDIFS